MGAFDADDWLIVEGNAADEDARAAPDLFGDFTVSYTDVVAVDYQALVEASSAVIARFPGVRRAVHADREAITCWGDPDLQKLDRALREWWQAELSE